jgi:proliferating cell nuclear antigen
LPSKTFQEIIKEMSGFGSDRIEITSYSRQLVFTNYGDKTKLSSEITLRQIEEQDNEIVDDNIKRISYEQSSDTIIKGDFSLHYLNYFIKATSMSPYMKIYIENDKPLVLEWNIGDLGVFRVVLMIKERK